MKYITNIAVYLTLIFAIKKMFFDNSINLGIIDKHYGITFFILLLILVTCELLNRKQKKRGEK